jgi:uncharacterized protein YukE
VADKVPSPMWQALNELYNDVSRNLQTVGGALQDADKRMAGGKGLAWVGPTARKWGSELSGASQDTSRQAHAFLDEVHRALTSQPKEVTEDQAYIERRVLAGRM